METALEVENLEKRYGATQALRRVSFRVLKGSTHAVIGENGAGKSTLIKLLCGLEAPDSGSIMLEGRRSHFRSLLDSRRAGVSTAFQELSLLLNLTVAENLFLPKIGRTRLGVLARGETEKAAAEILAKFDLRHLAPSQEVGTLSLADRQKLEIARAISHQPRLLLLDEPTAALADPEWLYEKLARIKNPDLTVLYISHRMNEIRDLCEYATVLRNGSLVETVRVDAVDDEEVFRMMAGSTSPTGERKATFFGSRDIGPPALKVNNLRGAKINGVSFTLHKGEILGVAGLQAQGQRDLFRILAGAARPTGGTIEAEGKALRLTNPSQALRQGISFIPEERKTEGILPGLLTLANVSISSLRKATVLGLLIRRREYTASLSSAQQVDLDTKYLRMNVDDLSGGNQQKAVIARSLMRQAKYLLMYDPCRGVDVGTKQALYEMMRSVTADGKSILWYSTDLHELSTECDRIIAFYRGAIVATLERGAAGVEDLMRVMTGQVATDRKVE